MSVRFGLIGYGAWGERHGVAIERTAGAELAAIAVRSEASRAKAKAAHPHAKVYADYRELLQRDDIDVADIVLPNNLHAAAGKTALEADKHVLMEKPMATTAADCRLLTDLAAARGRLLMVGFELRLSDLWGAVKQLVEQGKLGEPRYLLVELWRRPYRKGSDGWRYDIDRVGDWILEEPVHFFDLARWYFQGVGDPISVFARANSIQQGRPELQDNFSAIVRFPNEAHAVITHTLSAFEHHQTVKLTGTGGAVWASWSGVMDRDEQPSSSLKYFDGEEVHQIELKRRTGELVDLEDEIAMAVGAVRDGRAPTATGEDGYWSVALCEAAGESIRKGAEQLM